MQNDKPLDMLQIKIDRARDELPKATKKAIDSVDWRAFILSLRERKGYSFEQLEALELETELLLCGLLNPADYPKVLEEELKLPKPQIDLLVNEMNEFVFKKIKDELIRNTERESVFIKKETPDIISKETPLNKFANIKPNVIATEEHVMSPNVIKVNEPIKPTIETKNVPSLNKTTSLEIMPEELATPKQKATEAINKDEAGVLNKAGIEIISTSNTSNANLAGKENIPIPKPVIPNQAPLKTEMPVIPAKPENILKKEIIPEEKLESLFSQKLSGNFQIPTITTEYSQNDDLKNKPSRTSLLRDITKTSKADPYRLDPNAD